jgi:hypothetical protein
LTDVEIAAQAGVTDRQLRNWRADPAFAARVEEVARRLGDVSLRRAIARRARRVAALDRRWQAVQQVIAERAADPTMLGVPGGTTGLLVRTLKSIGSGSAAQVVEEFQVDTGLLQQILNLEKQAAQELGQWSEKREHAGRGGLLIEAKLTHAVDADGASDLQDDLALYADLLNQLLLDPGGSEVLPERALPCGNAATERIER